MGVPRLVLHDRGTRRQHVAKCQVSVFFVLRGSFAVADEILRPCVSVSTLS